MGRAHTKTQNRPQVRFGASLCAAYPRARRHPGDFFFLIFLLVLYIVYSTINYKSGVSVRSAVLALRVNPNPVLYARAKGALRA